MCRLKGEAREGPGGVRTASGTPSRRVMGGAGQRIRGSPVSRPPARFRGEDRARRVPVRGGDRSAVCAAHWPQRVHVTSGAKTAGRGARLPAGKPAGAAQRLAGAAKVAGGRSEDLRKLSGWER